jgi:hypothetical protein
LIAARETAVVEVRADAGADADAGAGAVPAVAAPVARGDVPRVTAERGLFDRAGPRCARVDPVESDALAPAEPDESEVPVVSAKAVGMAAIAEPTPSATANAPTRPTNRPPPTADQFPTARTDINDSFK